MGARIYRFEKIKEVGRSGANVIYEVRDTADSSVLQLYEWTAAPGEIEAGTKMLAQLGSSLNDGEVFPDGNRFYVAVSKAHARSVLDVLRTHRLFPGVWPGTLETGEPGKAKEAGSEVRGGPVISRWPVIIVLLLLVGLFAMIGWWRFRKTVQPLPTPSASGRKGPPSESAIPAVPEPVKIRRFSVEPRLTQSGQTWNVSWEVDHARTVVIKGLGPAPQIVDSYGTKNYTLPAATHDLVLEATGEGTGDVVSEARSIRYMAPQIEFHGVPDTVAVGDPFTLRWKVLGAERVQIDRLGPGALSHDGTEQIQTTGSRDYILSYLLTAQGPDGKTATAQVTERVLPKIVDFSTKRISTAAGQCEIWLVRWTVDGASGVFVNSVRSPASGYIVAHQAGRYTLEADNRGGTVSDTRSVSVSPGGSLCQGRRP
ncbi:MAG TPA: hypothetical protein VFF39_08270 [Verrucomicrobiae bacterium]|nr:hypothetical protein [Verrucomicrobiae bacterium]